MGRANFAMTSGSWWVDVMQGGTLGFRKDKGRNSYLYRGWICLQ